MPLLTTGPPQEVCLALKNGHVIKIKNGVEGGTKVSEVFVYRWDISRTDKNRLMVFWSEHNKRRLDISKLGRGIDMIMRNTIFNKNRSSTPARGWVGPVVPIAIIVRNFKGIIWSRMCLLD
ncbi:hypothetical protein TNCV_3421231 [Trichonephila clavipes]|nr:hypothetical protein TNCV_3421231 [Trichonephila clavipes]